MKNLFFLLVCFGVLGCGNGESKPLVPVLAPTISPVPTPDLPVPPKPLQKKVILAAWGAPWCHFCHEALPKLQNQMDKLDGTTRDQIDFRFYVPTGNRAIDPPDDKTTLAYTKSLGLNAVAYSDPKWKMFRFCVGQNMAIPAGCLLSADGKTVLKRYFSLVTDYQQAVYDASKEVAR